MASQYGVEELLIAIYVELWVTNQKASEDDGWDGEIAEMRADALAALVGNDTTNIGTPHVVTAESAENG